ncbi:MAG: hypothetical protein M1817_004948 [Caeruleum heppii]|nr:MAG: hypothetical protein M1817_004948 [Caeruleum heppii]
MDEQSRRAYRRSSRGSESSNRGHEVRYVGHPENLGGQQRREWAPDRSPLQKLELKLQDITKEEKRARVEEAELLVKEARAGRGGRSVSKRVQVSATTPEIETTTMPSDYPAQSGLARRSSTRQKVGSQHLHLERSHKPDGSHQTMLPESNGSHDFKAQDQRRFSQTRSLRVESDRIEEAQVDGASRGTRSVQEPGMSLDREASHGAGRQVPRAQQQLYIDRVGSSSDRADPASTSPLSRTLSASRRKSTRQGVTHGEGSRTPELSRSPSFGVGKAESRLGLGSAALASTANQNRRGGQQSRRTRANPEVENTFQDSIARLCARDLTLDAKLSDKGGPVDKAWWEGGGSATKRRLNGTSEPHIDQGKSGRQPLQTQAPTSFQPPLYLKCGPLLRYLGIRMESSTTSGVQTKANPAKTREIWRGSVMIVTTDSESSYTDPPRIRVFCQPQDLLPPPPAQLDGELADLAPEYVDPIAGLPKITRTGGTVYVRPVEQLPELTDLSREESEDGLYGSDQILPGSDADRTNGLTVEKGRLRSKTANARVIDGETVGRYSEAEGIRLHSERGVTFWRFSIEVELGQQQSRIAYRINRGPATAFWVPARDESMNIMFHSCNGFSLSVDPNDLSGPDPLWRDVLNAHQTRPFHVMIGGGDQIYNDAVLRQTTLFQQWVTIKNPLHKHSAEFTAAIKEELETFYLERYALWFSQGLFGMANSQIPMVNMWDDHDIIDGFGSYPHHFMSAPVFRGLGNVAFRYYMLFQHHSLGNEDETDEPSWLTGSGPGPYIAEQSRSVFVSLGRKVALLALDCRTERTRDEILTPETYDLVFERCQREIIKGETKHLIVVLGVPIAYPRLVWLENILTSRLMDPVKAIGRSGMLGGLLNQFDGGVEVLDDLDDHWTARNHKAERNWFVQELQDLAASNGDVHLAAVGQFYSKPSLGIAKDKDHRYMPNIVSSAIVNTPPPEMLGDILNKRNKVHHLDSETDEDMIRLFTHDVDGRPRKNNCLLPRRNWCCIREYQPGSTPPPTPPTPLSPEPVQRSPTQQSPGFLGRRLSISKNDVRPGNLLRRVSLRRPSSRAQAEEAGLETPGVQRPATAASADGYFPPQPATTNGGVQPRPQRPTSFYRRTTERLERRMRAGRAHAGQNDIDLEEGLDILLNLEVSSRDPAGITMPYRLLVPALWCEDLAGEAEPQLKRRWTTWGRRRQKSAKPAGIDQDDESGPAAGVRRAATFDWAGALTPARAGNKDPDQSQAGMRPSWDPSGSGPADERLMPVVGQPAGLVRRATSGGRTMF